MYGLKFKITLFNEVNPFNCDERPEGLFLIICYYVFIIQIRKRIGLEKTSGCLVVYFKQQFSVFEQHVCVLFMVNVSRMIAFTIYLLVWVYGYPTTGNSSERRLRPTSTANQAD